MAKKTVIVNHGKGRSQKIHLEESNREGQNYHFSKGHEGLHFPNLDGVEGYFKRRFPDSEIEIK